MNQMERLNSSISDSCTIDRLLNAQVAVLAHLYTIYVMVFKVVPSLLFARSHTNKVSHPFRLVLGCFVIVAVVQEQLENLSEAWPF